MPGTTAYRVLQGEQLDLTVVSSFLAVLHPAVRVLYDNGKTDTIHFGQSVVTLDTRTVETFSSQEHAKQDGWVVGAVINATAAGKRGQTWVRLSLGPTDGPVLCFGYVYAGHPVSLNEFIEPGPGGGEGFQGRTVVNNALPADLTQPLSDTNTFKKIYGFAIYYKAAAVVATRTIVASIRIPFGFLPTGGTAANSVVWTSPTLSLTTGEQGSMMVYAYEGGQISVVNDNGTLSTANVTTAPTPFPLRAIEGELAELFIDVTAVDAGDLWTVFLKQEEWLMD